MKTAIIYDWVDKQGGVERLLESLVKTFPEADIYTSIYNPATAPWAKDLNVRTSFMQSLPGFIKNNRVLSALLFPFAFESFQLAEYDLVISVSSAFAKGVITRPETKHVSILLTSTRYIWGMKEQYQRSRFFNMIAAPFLSRLRTWDFIAAQRPDRIIAISQLVAERVKKDYKREAEVAYPPFNTDYWSAVQPAAVTVPTAYYLVVARLEPYKRVDLVMEAMKALPTEHLIVVGSGSREEALRAQAGKNVTFLEAVSDAQLAYLYSHARGLVMPQEEDFGYTALEAAFFNCPVLSYRQSGAAEVIEEGKTGAFFEEQTVDSVRAALESFASVPYNVASYKKKILDRFSVSELLNSNYY